LVGDGGKEGDDAGGGGREKRCVVGGGKHEGVVAAGGMGFAAVLDGFPGRLSSTANNDREAGEASGVEGGPGCGGHGLSFGVCEVDGFAIGTLGSNSCHAGFGKADCMAGNGCRIQVFSNRIEEADSRDVDSWDQGAGDAVLDINGAIAIGGAVLVQWGL